MQRPAHGGNLEWAAGVARCQPQEILDFSASINPLGPPESAIAALQAAIPSLRHYPDPSYRRLRQALADHHQLSAEWILPGNGAADLLTWAGRDLATLDCVYLCTPAFGDYRRALAAFGSRVQPWPLAWSRSGALQGEAFAVPVAATDPIEAWVQSWPPQAGCLLNDPHNPTGQRLDPRFLQACLNHFEQVVIDEAFLDFLPPADQHSAIDRIVDYPNLTVIRSLTKFYSLPGLRLGYAVAHPDHLRRWQQWRDPWAVNSLAISVGAAVMTDGAFQQRTWDWLPPARWQLFRSLQQIPVLSPIPSVSNFLLVECQASVSQLQFWLLQEARILVRDCLSFPELGDGYFRVAVLQAAQQQQLQTALSARLGLH